MSTYQQRGCSKVLSSSTMVSYHSEIGTLIERLLRRIRRAEVLEVCSTKNDRIVEGGFEQQEGD